MENNMFLESIKNQPSEKSIITPHQIKFNGPDMIPEVPNSLISRNFGPNLLMPG